MTLLVLYSSSLTSNLLVRIFSKGLLHLDLVSLFICMLIEAQGARLLRDERIGETPNGAKRQEAHRTPRGKRTTWSGNQPHPRAQINAKTAFKKDLHK
jgi:hypothetical protein